VYLVWLWFLEQNPKRTSGWLTKFALMSWSWPLWWCNMCFSETEKLRSVQLHGYCKDLTSSTVPFFFIFVFFFALAFYPIQACVTTPSECILDDSITAFIYGRFTSCHVAIAKLKCMYKQLIVSSLWEGDRIVQARPPTRDVRGRKPRFMFDLYQLTVCPSWLKPV